MSHVHEHNRRAWDARVQRGDWYTETVPAIRSKRQAGAAEGPGWLGEDVRGRRVLCLAAGGGKQAIEFAEAGALVTVVDISPAMLALDRQAAKDRNLKLRIVEASMDGLSCLEEASFDLVVQPVSTCYVPDVEKVYHEVARVIRAGGLYASQHKQPASLQTALVPSAHGYLLTEPYYRTGPLPAVPPGTPHRESGTLEFLHRWDQLLGGMCRAGFVIEDIREPMHADPNAASDSFARRCCFVPPYIQIKARRNAPREASAPRIWTPSNER